MSTATIFMYSYMSVKLTGVIVAIFLISLLLKCDLLLQPYLQQFNYLFGQNQFSISLRLISLTPGGGEANESSKSVAISTDGRYIVFASQASNLVSDDENSQRDIFLYNQRTGKISCITRSFSGTEANLGSRFPSLSKDGQYIVFSSQADNLVPVDSNGTIEDVFVYDIQRGETKLIGPQVSALSAPSISSNGRYIAFSSLASNLVIGDSNNYADVFVYDQETEQINLVSVGVGNSEANHSSIAPSISGNGRYVVFVSFANNLVPNDMNNEDDIFVHDRVTGETSRVSVASDGAEANARSLRPVISANGRYIAFASWADNLDSNDTNETVDVFVYDQQTSQTTRVSITSDDPQGVNGGDYPAISGNGRYIVFYTSPVTTSPQNGIFIYDLFTHQLTPIAPGYENADEPGYLSISVDGHYVAFASDLNNLVTNDTNNFFDIFVYENVVPEETTYNLSGRVVDNKGQPVAGVLVSAGEWYQSVTDSSGVYTITLIAGTYQLTVEPAGATITPPTQSIQVPSDTPPRISSGSCLANPPQRPKFQL